MHKTGSGRSGCAVVRDRGNLDPYRMTANHAFQQEFAVKKQFMPIDPYDNQSGEIESETRGFASYEVETEKIFLN